MSAALLLVRGMLVLTATALSPQPTFPPVFKAIKNIFTGCLACSEPGGAKGAELVGACGKAADAAELVVGRVGATVGVNVAVSVGADVAVGGITVAVGAAVAGAGVGVAVGGGGAIVKVAVAGFENSVGVEACKVGAASAGAVATGEQPTAITADNNNRLSVTIHCSFFNISYSQNSTKLATKLDLSQVSISADQFSGAIIRPREPVCLQ